MSPRVLDVICLKTIEKEIGRKLDEIEIEVIELGEPIFLQDRNNNWISRYVPTYRFPHDLMVQDIDLAPSLTEINIFEFAFTVGPVSSVRRV